MTGESDQPTPSTDPDQPDPTDPMNTDPSPDPKTAPDGTPIERAIPPEQWEAVGRRALSILLDDRRLAVEDAVGELVSAIDYGAPVDEVHVQNLRDAIAGLESVVEYDVVELVEDATPWEQTAGRVPFGRIADALGVEMDDLNELRTTAESDDDEAAEDRSAGGPAS